MLRFNIADLILGIVNEDAAMIDSLNKYTTTNVDRDPDLMIVITRHDFIERPSGRMLSDEQVVWLIKDQKDDGFFLYARETKQGRLVALLDVDADWSHGFIKALISDNKKPEDDYSLLTDFYVSHMIGLIFRYKILYRNGIVVHASSIAWNGKGIMFSAPSGTGKSTHVKLWQDHLGTDVKIVNDDTPAVRLLNGKPYIFGTPWSGNGTNCNIAVPLEAIVILEQANENQVKQLSAQEAILNLIPRCFIPYFNKDFIDTAMTVFEKIILSVPVYLLKCRPDKEAVEMIYQCLK